MTIEEQKKLIKQRLQDSDYAMLSDVAIDNKDEFTTYRYHLRQMYFADYEIQIIPEVPDPIWTEAE